jgi:hypothetical protein
MAIQYGGDASRLSEIRDEENGYEVYARAGKVRLPFREKDGKRLTD